MQWSACLNGRTTLGIIPDRYFGLEFPDHRRAFYFLEADRATMPVMRQRLTQTSLYRKLLAYEATWTQNIHRDHLRLPRFRVLTVTTSGGRAKHLADACAKLARGHGLFLFADSDALRRHGDPLTFPWQTPHSGKTASLLE